MSTLAPGVIVGALFVVTLLDDALRAGGARCVKCGCTDSSPCAGGCVWFAVDRKIGLGLCSMCDLNDREREAAVKLWIRRG